MMNFSPLLAQQGPNDSAAIMMILAAVAIIVVMIGLFAIVANFFWLWAQSFTTGAGIGLSDLIGMWFRRVDARTIVRSKIMSVQAGLGNNEITSAELEAHYLAGGNVPQVIRAMIAARKSKMINLEFRQAAAID
ncbi:MAG: flotillin-like FloA family protein, partial [Planctomycetales bacterium]|nr:flotillin-like FloA family protein [Planctomycetales bacterium]